MNQGRRIYWDVIKGIAIILMVMGHSIEYGGGQIYRDSGMMYDNILFQLIYSFHMPLFMLVSGYLFYKTEGHHSAKEILKRKFFQLFIPICSFSLINFALKFEPGWHLINYLRLLLQTFCSTLWFLWVLFIIALIQLGLKKINIDRRISNLIVLLVLYILPNVWHLPMLAYMYPFFLIGYYLSAEGIMHREIRNLLPKAVTFIVVYIALFLQFNRGTLVYESGTCLLSSSNFKGQLFLDFYRVLIGAVGCFAVLYLVKWFETILGENNKVAVLLSSAGFLSMGIYCFQDSVLCVYHHFTRSIAQPAFLWWALAFVVIFGLCLVATLISKRVKFLNTYLLGGR